MDITDIQINLVDSYNGDLRAVCSVVFDNDLVVREITVIEENRKLFVRMPDKKITGHCNKCNEKNPIHSKFCSKCGVELTWQKVNRDKNIHSDVYTDIVDVINNDLFKLICQKVLKAYQDNLSAAAQAGMNEKPGETAS
jgi:stage V sporulation protein G